MEINQVIKIVEKVFECEEGIVNENSPVLPRNDYAITHLFGEEYVKYFNRTKNLPFTIIRLSNSYGCPKEVLKL